MNFFFLLIKKRGGVIRFQTAHRSQVDYQNSEINEELILWELSLSHVTCSCCDLIRLTTVYLNDAHIHFPTLTVAVPCTSNNLKP